MKAKTTAERFARQQQTFNALARKTQVTKLEIKLKEVEQECEAWRSDAQKWEGQALQLLGDLDSLKRDFCVKTEMLIAAQKALAEMHNKFVVADTARVQAADLCKAERRRADEMDMQNKELRVTLAYYVALAQRIVRP